MVTFAQYYWSPTCAKLFAIKQNQQNRSAIKHNLLTCANNRACITLFCSGFGSAKFAGTQNCKMVTSAQYFFSPTCAKLFAIKQKQQKKSVIKHNLLTHANTRACITLYAVVSGQQSVQQRRPCRTLQRLGMLYNFFKNSNGTRS